MEAEFNMNLSVVERVELQSMLEDSPAVFQLKSVRLEFFEVVFLVGYAWLDLVHIGDSFDFMVI